MTTYAIGDIQGCYLTLRKLLKLIRFDTERDNLWLAGDLINRGPRSLETLSFLYRIRENVKCVLGNHDLHFLAVEAGCYSAKKKDTFVDILKSPKREKLVTWLTRQPLSIYDSKYNVLMVHAGLYPTWSVSDALRYGKEVSGVIRSKKKRTRFFNGMYGNLPNLWDENLSGNDRLRCITNCLTRMRYLGEAGELDFSTKTVPGTQTKNLKPWYEFENKKLNCDLVFGHWGWLKGSCSTEQLHGIDSGCVYGGELTAMRLEDKKRFHYKMVD